MRIFIARQTWLAVFFFILISGAALSVPAHAQDNESEAMASQEALETTTDEALDASSEMTDSTEAEIIEGEPTEGTLAEDVSADSEMVSDDELAAVEPSRLQPIFDLIDAGGPIIIILAILSVVSLMVIVVKLVQFTLLRVGDYRFVESIWDLLRAGKLDEALDTVSARTGVIARVMETALHGKKLAGNSEAAREEAERVARAKIDGLERGLPLLSLIATISPLLGLLGTVLGMIEAFQQLEGAGDRVDPAILSGGIWEALLTTAAGLSVAIPAAAFFTWLQRTVDVAAEHMEDAAIRVFTYELYTPSADDQD